MTHVDPACSGNFTRQTPAGCCRRCCHHSGRTCSASKGRMCHQAEGLCMLCRCTATLGFIKVLSQDMHSAPEAYSLAAAFRVGQRRIPRGWRSAGIGIDPVRGSGGRIKDGGVLLAAAQRLLRLLLRFARHLRHHLPHHCARRALCRSSASCVTSYTQELHGGNKSSTSNAAAVEPRTHDITQCLCTSQ
jgi:hypothetical protein